MSEATTGRPEPAAARSVMLATAGKRQPGARWQSRLWDATPTSVLLDEASRLADARRWRHAVRILAVAATTTDEEAKQHDVLRRLAVTAADGGRHRLSCDAVFELQKVEPRHPDTWIAFANVALARGNYVHADRSARAVLASDPHHQGAWAVLAASYAGLGWFDEAGEALDRLDRGNLSELQRWRIGRAVNRWSLTSSRWLPVAALSALVLGILAVAIAVSVPFVARELRLRRLRANGPTASFDDLAADAWRHERRLRLIHAVAVSLSVAGFAVFTVLP